ncbi:CAAX amino terminal protease self- immunity [compost metagenome]
MIGIVVELIISWLILWIYERKNLSILGLMPTKSRLKDLAFGILMAAGIGITYHLLRAYTLNNSWRLNVEYTFLQFLTALWWVFKSVLFEELIFRGALLYIAIKKIGIHKACLLSAACFGVYHWFTMGAFGNPFQLIIVFIMTGIAGLAFAYAFAKTKSLYLPFALHFGWNVITIVIFSNGPLGLQLFIYENLHSTHGTLSSMIFLFQIFALPIGLYFYLGKKQMN